MKLDPRDQFGREAEKYLTSAVHADSAALQTLVDLVQPKGGKVVDVGTGAGHLAFAFAPYVESMIALDPTPQMLEVTAREAARRGLNNLTTVEANAESLPFDDQSLDGLSCRMAAHHFDSVPLFVREAARTLKPGAWLLIVDTVAPDDPTAARELNEIEALRDPSHGRDWTVREWVDEVEQAGFEVLAIHDRLKRLDLQDWMDRMSVPTSDQVRLRDMCHQSTGVLRAYLDPGDGQINLQEMSLFARKRG